MTDTSAITVLSSQMGTSSGANAVAQSLRIICVAGALSLGLGATHSSHGSTHDPLHELAAQTNSGFPAEQKSAVGPAIMALRRLSGMTWEQVAGLFEVSRRTVHFWASGKALNSYNEEKLYRILSTVQEIDRGSARENRELLFTAVPGGVAPIELLRAGHYAEVVRLVGTGSFDRPQLTALSREARSARMPQSPETLVDARQDKVAIAMGRTRPARAVRVKNKKRLDTA